MRKKSALLEAFYELSFWAKAHLMRVVETLSEESFTKDRGASHGGIHETLMYFVGAEHIWMPGINWSGRFETS